MKQRRKMSKEVLDKIMRATGRYPVECDCPRCRRQCLTPCLGTPEDIWRLIEAGYEKELRVTFWAVGILAGKVPFPILMVQPLQTGSGCVFWKDGLCRLHGSGLKPTEGRLSYHILTEENTRFEKSLGWNVAKEWIDETNILLITKILQRMNVKI